MPPPWSPEEYRHFNEGGSIDLVGLPSLFTPDLTYELTLTITGGEGTAYGFQLVSIYDDLTQAGELAPITQGTGLRDYARQGFPVSYLSHYSPLNTNTIQVRWKAPINPKGPVIFRFAGNSASGHHHHDFIYFRFKVTIPGPPLEPAHTLYCPLFAHGSFGQGSFRTSLYLYNTGKDVEVDTSFFDHNSGQAMPVDLIGFAHGSEISIGLKRGQTVSLHSEVTGSLMDELQLGYVKLAIRSASQPQGSDDGLETLKVGATAVLTRLQNGTVVYETGMPAVQLQTDFTFLLDSLGEKDTGIVMLNPVDENEGEAARVLITVWNKDFDEQIAATTVELGAGKAISLYVWELFRDFGDASQQLMETLRETEAVVVVSSEPGIAPFILRENYSGSAALTGIPTVAVFPVIPGAPSP